MGAQQQHSDVCPSCSFVTNRCSLERPTSVEKIKASSFCVTTFALHVENTHAQSAVGATAVIIQSPWDPPTPHHPPHRCSAHDLLGEVDDPGFSLVIASASHPVAVCRIWTHKVEATGEWKRGALDAHRWLLSARRLCDRTSAGADPAVMRRIGLHRRGRRPRTCGSRCDGNNASRDPAWII